MAEKELNKIIVLEPCTPAVEELLKKIEGANQAELIRLNNPDEAVQLVKQHQPCMLFTCTINNADIPIRVNMLKKLEQSIKYGLVKTLFVSKLKNRQLGTLITSLGVTDFIEEPVPARTLQFKANLQLKAVDTVRKQQELKKASQEKIVFKKSEQKQDGAQVTAETNAKLKPALKLEEDTFLFKNSGIKKVGKKTLVELEGPDPETGEWVPHEDKGDAKTSWRWVPNEKKALPPEEAKKEGWTHEGDKPQFNEETGKWQFGSEKPELSYQKNGEKIASKITTDESGEVNVAEDSPKAEENLKKNKEIAVKKREKEKAAPEKKEFKTNEKNEDQAATLKSLNKEKTDEKIEIGQKGKTDPDALEKQPDLKIGKSAESEQEKGLSKAMEKIGSKEPAPENQDPKSTASPEKKDEKPKNPLDFLKKKLEEKNKSAEKILSKEMEEAEPDNVVSLKQQDQAEENGEAKSISTPGESRKKSGKSSTGAAKEALERLKKKAEMNAKFEAGINEKEEAQQIKKSAEQPEETQEEISAGKGSEQETDGKEVLQKPDLQKKQREKKIAKEKAPKLTPEERKSKKRDILGEIQAVLNKPLPETMSEEEESKLREELGLQGRKEIPVKELAKRAKLNKVKELKDKLEQLNGFKEEEADFNKHDLKKDEIDNTWSKKGDSGEKERSKINAYDSEDSEETENDSISETKKKEKDQKPAREKKPIEDRYLYLPESEVKPLGGAWESAGEYYVFLEATVRYKGFDKIDSLCPMLFYRGEKIPELLDKTKQWRFLDRLPQTATKFSEVPREVRDYLLNLKNQLESNKEKKEKPKEKTLGEVLEEKKRVREQEKAEKEREILEKTSKKQEEEFAELMSSLGKNSEDTAVSETVEEIEKHEEEEIPETANETENSKPQADSEEPEVSTESESKEELVSSKAEKEKKKPQKSNLKDLMASLEKEAAEQKDIFETEEKEEDPSSRSDAETDSENAEKKERTENSEQEDEKITSGATEAPTESEEEEKERTNKEPAAELTEEKKKKDRSKESNDLESRLAALKSKIEDPFAEEVKEEKDSAEAILEEAPKKVKPESPLQSEGVDAVKDKLKSESPALEKFLERRKNKKERPPKDLGKNPPAPKLELGPQGPYLGVYVAISNAFGSDKNPTRSAQRILISLEASFGNCSAFIFFDKGPIEAGTVQISADGSGIGEKIPIANGLIRPIQFGVGSEEGSFLGYLFLRPSGTREFFSSAEEDTATKVAASLWSVLVRNTNSEAKAA